MVYQVSESAQFYRYMAPLPEWRKQHACEISTGHKLTLIDGGINIKCSECGAEWRKEPRS